MDLASSFILLSGIAYLVCLFIPFPCTKQFSKIHEYIVFTIMAAILGYTSQEPFTWFIHFPLAVLYVAAAVTSYFGVMEWNVSWTNKTLPSIQLAMWAWDLLLALAFLSKT